MSVVALLRGRSFPTRRQLVVSALAVAVAAVGLLVASAATLGGVAAGSLGADVSVVASCDTDGVGVDFTNGYDATTGVYRVTSATVSGIAAPCNGLSISVTVVDAADASIAEGSGTVAGGSASLPLTATGSTDPAAAVAVVITG